MRSRENAIYNTDTEDLANAADALYFAMRKARTAVADESSSLSQAQIALLDPLSSGQELPVGRLAADAGVSVPTATRMLQQLEAKSVLKRRRSPTDERRVLVRLTPDGADQLVRLRNRMRERQAQAAEAFTPAERVQLIELIRRLTEIISNAD
jgi:DNA-binding MarR family transcriptional regulator